ncbi:MAG TPA: PAS domain S-box protein, partial [Chitinophagales bacterium]
MNDREKNIFEQYESTTILKNGEAKTVWVESRPFRDKNNDFIGSIIVVKDIQEERDREKFIKHNTQYLERQIAERTRELQIYAREMEAEIRIREEAQFALLETDKRLRTLFYNSPDAVFVQRLDGTIIDTNEAFASLYGYTRNEVIGRHVSEMLNTDNTKTIEDIQKKILAKELTNFEIVGRHKDGHSIPFSVNAAIIEYDREPSILLHARDISERIHYQKELEAANKQLDQKVKERTQDLEKANTILQKEIAFSNSMQQQLRQQYSFFQTLIDINPNMIFVKNRAHQYIVINDAFANFYGLAKDEIIGRTPDEIVGREINDNPFSQFDEQDEIAMGNPDTYFEFSLSIDPKYKRGTYYKVIKQAVKNYDSDEYLVLGIMIDLSDIKTHEYYLIQSREELRMNNIKLQRSNEELERFAYIASHDLQSPLKTIISFLQLLESRYGNKIGADGKEFIEYCVSASTRMRQLISDILQYSRLNATPKLSDNVDVNKLLFVVTKNLEANIKATNAIIHAAELPTIKAEPYLVVQLLQNIIDNAIKFVADKQPVILISVSENPTHWVFSIKDNGIGISPEYKEKIFQIFHRLHTSSEYAGTGIGLAICKKVAELHQGEIWIESEVE